MIEFDVSSVFSGFEALAWSETFRGMTDWVWTKYQEAPALVFGVGVALILPALAAVGVMARQVFRAAGPGNRANEVPATERTQPASAWRQQAWLEAADSGAPAFQLRPGLARIGRESDNDLCLSDPTVHRYHAVLEQTPEAEYVISYVGDPDREGLIIDGQPVRRQRLRGGEVLVIGSIKLRFRLHTA